MFGDSPSLIGVLQSIADAIRGDRGQPAAAKYYATGNSGVLNYWQSFTYDAVEFQSGGLTKSGIYLKATIPGNYQVNVSARAASGQVMPRVLVCDEAGAVQNGKGFGGAVQPAGSVAHCSGLVALKKDWSIVVQFGGGGTTNGQAGLPATDFDFANQVQMALVK